MQIADGSDADAYWDRATLKQILVRASLFWELVSDKDFLINIIGMRRFFDSQQNGILETTRVHHALHLRPYF